MLTTGTPPDALRAPPPELRKQVGKVPPGGGLVSETKGVVLADAASGVRGACVVPTTAAGDFQIAEPY